MNTVEIPFARCAGEIIARLVNATGSTALAALNGPTLLGERAMLAIPGRISAGDGCWLYDALGDAVALNLARATDRELLPALFETEGLNAGDAGAIAAGTPFPPVVRRPIGALPAFGEHTHSCLARLAPC